MSHIEKFLMCASTAREAIVKDWNNNSSFPQRATDHKAFFKNSDVFEKEFRHAIDNNELMLYYQPKTLLNNGEIFGIEALVRWNHPEFGLIYPNDFIPLAENTGLILPMSSWVLNEACRQMQLWQQRKLVFIKIFVNISPFQLKIPDFVEDVQATLKKYHIDPKYFGIEVTESAAMDNKEKTRETLDKLIKIGITVSIDDFGTGYSSLSKLRNFPFSIIKIDWSFIKELPHSKNSADFVRSILSTAALLGIVTLAEGVETQSQFDFLQNHGCNLIQGYIISPPLSAEAIENFLLIYNLGLKNVAAIQHPAADKTEGIKLTDLLESAEIETMQDNFTQLTKISAALFDLDLNPLTGFSFKNNPVCQLLQPSADDKQLCKKIHQGMAQKAYSQKEPFFISKCPISGLTGCAIPIIIEGEHIATWFMGRCRLESSTPKSMRKWAVKTGQDPDLLEKYFWQTPVVSTEQFKNAATLLSTYVNELAEKWTGALQTKRQMTVDQHNQQILKLSLNQEKLINTIYAIILSSDDISVSINKVLRLLGQYFDVSNVYIMEVSADWKTCVMTYEWIMPGYESVSKLCNEPMLKSPAYYSLFHEGVLCVDDMSGLSAPIAACYDKTGCQSIFQAIIIVGGAIVGHIGLTDTKKTNRVWSRQEINILKSIANIFSAALTRVRADREIAGYYQRMKVVMDHIDAMIMVLDATTFEILFSNERFKQTYSFKDESGQTCWEVMEDGLSEPCENCIYPKEGGLAVGETQIVEKYNAKLNAWHRTTSTGIFWLDNRPAILQTSIDITSQKKQEILISEMAYEDTLTGLANRRAMERYLESKFEQFKQTYHPICIAMLDIDDFKVVNDTYGHDTGDAILKSTADLLRVQVRSNDKVCRWGGEEFVIFFDDVSLTEAAKIADRLREDVKKSVVHFGDLEHSVTVSIGVAEVMPDDKDYTKALFNADKSMYVSKMQGKNQVTYLDCKQEETEEIYEEK